MRQTKMRRMRRLLVVPLIGASMLGVTACDDDDSAGPEMGTSAEQVVEDDSDALLGKTVTISGEVSEVIAPNAFTVGENIEESLLVVSAPAAGGPLVEEGAVVSVTGTVDEFVFHEFEDELELGEEENFTEFEEENFIVASSVAPAPAEDGE